MRHCFHVKVKVTMHALSDAVQSSPVQFVLILDLVNYFLVLYCRRSELAGCEYGRPLSCSLAGMAQALVKYLRRVELTFAQHVYPDDTMTYLPDSTDLSPEQVTRILRDVVQPLMQRVMLDGARVPRIDVLATAGRKRHDYDECDSQADQARAIVFVQRTIVWLRTVLRNFHGYYDVSVLGTHLAAQIGTTDELGAAFVRVALPQIQAGFTSLLEILENTMRDHLPVAAVCAMAAVVSQANELGLMQVVSGDYIARMYIIANTIYYLRTIYTRHAVRHTLVATSA